MKSVKYLRNKNHKTTLNAVRRKTCAQWGVVPVLLSTHIHRYKMSGRFHPRGRSVGVLFLFLLAVIHFATREKSSVV